MAKQVRTISKDRGYKRIIGQVDLIKRSPHVLVGFFAGQEGDDDSGLTIAEYMLVNELGSPENNIPERPVMATTVDDEKRIMGEYIDDQLWKVITGRSSVKRSLSLIGVKFQGLLRKAITAWDTPPNAPSTQIKKGSEEEPVDNPLVDTGTAIQAVSWEVKGE